MRSKEFPILAYVMLALTALSTLLLGAFALYDERAQDARRSGELRQKLTGLAERLALSADLPIWNFDLEQLDGIADSHMGDPEVAGLLIQLEDVKKTRIIRGRGPQGQVLRLSSPPPADTRLMFAHPVDHRGELIGYVSVYGSAGPKDAELRAELRRHLLSILALDLGLVALIYLFLWSSILRPLKTLEDFTHEVAQGKAGAQLGLRSDLLEIDRLAASVRTMVQLLDERYESLQRSEARARQTQKMESVGQLAGGVAHDFNNILQLILTCAELAKDGLPPGHPALAELQAIIEGGGRGTRLVKQLLQFSRRQVFEPRLLRLEQSIPESVKMLGRLLGETVKVEARCEPGLGLVKADPGHLEQLLMNLCINARDAMPQGGRISIELLGASLSAAEALAYPGAAEGAYAVIAVADQGEGIRPEVLQHLFEPFFTTKAPGKGTGLGLATCFGIAAESGGFISVESEWGHGATFKVWLPRLQDAGQGASPEALPTPASAANTEAGHEQILLAEDDEGIRQTLGRLLRSRGYQVADVPGPQEGLARAAAQRFDLVLTDLVMPDMPGMEFCRLLREKDPGLRVVFMSGYAQGLAGQELRLGPHDAFLPKPFTPEALLQKIRLLLDRA